MAEQTNDVIQTTGQEISGKSKFDFKAFFPRMLHPGKKHGQLPRVPDKSPTSVNHDESQSFAAETRVGGAPPLPAKTKARGSVMKGNDVAPDREAALQGDASSANTHPDHDLWARAWHTLSKDEQTQLEQPWKSPSSQTDSLQDVRDFTTKPPLTDGSRKEVTKGNKIDYVQEVVKGANQALEQRTWGTPDTPSKAAKVVDSVLIFKNLGDAVAKFDPSGYASSAWTVVSFGLTLVDQDKKRMDEAFKASAYLAELLTRYCKTEAYYHHNIPDDSDREQLENAIVEVYKAILKYSLEIKNVVNGSISDRIIGALAEKGLKDLQDTIKEKEHIMERWEKKVDRNFTTLFHEITKKSLEDIGKEVVEIVGVLGTVQAGVAATKEGVDFLVTKEVMDYLCPTSSWAAHTTRHGNIADSMYNLGHGSIVSSVVEKPQYEDWKQNPGREVLWLHAPSGYGKSWLCCSIIDDIAKTCAPKNPQRILLYWYFEKDVKRLSTIYRSFMRQLAEGVNGIFPKDIQVWLKEAPTGVTWREELEKWLKALKRHVFVVLDGLDELSQGKSQHYPHTDAFQLISVLIDRENPYVHVLILSKNDNIIRDSLYDRAEGVLEMDIRDDLRKDLGQFVERTMEEDGSFNGLKLHHRNAINRRLEQFEDRNFSWATSLLEDLRSCSGEEIKDKLQKVPRLLAQKYQHDLKGLDKDEKPKIRRIFMWLLRHKRGKEPLTTTELTAATDLKLSELKMLFGFVREIVTMLPSDRAEKPGRQDDASSDYDSGSASDSASDTDSGSDSDGRDESPRHVAFVHSSAKDYLEELRVECEEPALADGMAAVPPSHWAQWLSFSNEEAHHAITRRCLKVLLDNDAADAESSKASPLKSYAARHWHYHYLAVASPPLPSKATASDTAAGRPEDRPSTKDYVAELECLIKELLEPGSAAFESWLDSYNPDEGHAQRHSEPRWDGDEHEQSSSLGDDDDDGNKESVIPMVGKARADPIYYAVKLGLLHLVIQILKAPPRRTYRRPGNEGTVLQLALYHQHWDVVNTLLEFCDDIKTAITAQDGPHGTPLYIASAFGKDDIVGNLLQYGALDGTKQGTYGGALHAAAYFGHITTVQLLLDQEKGVVDLEAGPFATALHAAAARGHADIVQWLLENEADPTRVGGLFGTALQAALISQSESAADISNVLRKAIHKRGLESDNPSKIGWKSAFFQMQESSPSLLLQYTTLLLPTDEKRQIQNDFDHPRQRVLVAVLQNWMLPGSTSLSRCLDLVMKFLYQAPIQEHLEDVRRALPTFEDNSRQRDLNKVDFIYKGLFWSGVNYILENLGKPVLPAMASMEKTLGRGGTFPIHDGDGFELELERAERRWRRFRFWNQRRDENTVASEWDAERDAWWEGLGKQTESSSRYYTGRAFRKVDMDLSDKMILALKRKQEMVSMQQLAALGDTRLLKKSATPSRRSVDERGLDDGEGEDGDNEGDSSHSEDHDSKHNDHESNVEIHGVVYELLPLLKDIVEFGRQCDRLHGTATSVKDTETIKRLSFEVFAAVARLAVSIREWEKDKGSTTADDSLAQTVRLLRTVRLARLTSLSAAVTLNELPFLVRREMAPLMDNIRDQICREMRESVRAELEHQREARDATPPTQPEKQRSHKWQGISDHFFGLGES